jgi:hypothetical protein
MLARSQAFVRALDVDLLGVGFMGLGLLALAGAAVQPALDVPAATLLRATLLSLLLLVLGLGLLRRWNWARRFAAGAMLFAVHAQLTRRWMQSEVVQTWLGFVQGRVTAELPLDGGLPPLGADQALASLLLCVLLACCVVRLLGEQLRAECSA